MSKMLLTTKLTQRLLMNQQLTQVINLLQYTTLELKQQIMAVLETNPLIELEEETVEEELDNTQYISPNTSQNVSYQDHGEDYYGDNTSAKLTLRESLLQQTLNSQFTPVQQLIAEAIIDSLDESGYLCMSLDEIQVALQSVVPVDFAQIESVLAVIQKFDPAGVGARSTQECLLLQLDSLADKTPEHHYARQIIASNMLNLDEFNLAKIAKATNMTEDQIIDGLNVIKSLSFAPGIGFANEISNDLDPEIYVRKMNHIWKAFLSDSILTRIGVNKEYRSLIKGHSRDKSYKTVLNQLNEAQLFINGIKRRNNTLLDVAAYIVKEQQDFFENGKKSLKSLTMHEVATALECHESTISRITTGKYMATPHGVFELKFFFPSHVKTTAGDSMSSIAIKEKIEGIIHAEDPVHPYSDEQIAVILKNENIHISRRTVTKYRESLNIPTSYLRPGMNITRKKTLEPA